MGVNMCLCVVAVLYIEERWVSQNVVCAYERRPMHTISYREQSSVVCEGPSAYASGVCSAEVVVEASAPGGGIFLTVPLLPLRAERRLM